MQRVDGLAGLLNVLANAVRDPGTQQHAMVNANVLTSHKAVSETHTRLLTGMKILV